MPRENAVKHWVFTLNNPTQVEVGQLSDNWQDTFSYLLFGREVGENGTPHLQGYFALKERKRLASCRQLAGLGRAHFERMRGSPAQAIAYCKKDGDFDEFGEQPRSGQGKRTDFEDLREWVKAQPISPSMQSVWEAFPSLAGRYPSAVRECIEIFGKRPTLVDGQLRAWQRDLVDILNAPPDDRRVVFCVDPAGGKGKSWITRYLFSTRDDVQRLSVGKRDDLAYAIDESKKVFIFDIPRGQSEYLQFGILEQLKDQMVFSPKYQSTTKILREKVHVVVFMNEDPDMNRMTRDRYRMIRLNEYN